MRLGRILAVGFVTLVALLLLANGFMAWRVRAQFNWKVAAIRAAGDPASLDDLTPNPIPETENAAEVLAAIGPRLKQFSKEHGKFFDTPVGKAFEARTDRGLPATPEQIAAIKKIVDNYPDIDAKLAAAATCDQYASVADFSAGPQKFLQINLNGGVNDVRTASRFIGWRMQTLIAEGKQEEAAKLGIECLKLARLWDNEPLVVNALVGIAIRNIIIHSIYDALAAGPISAATRAALDQELAISDDPQRLVHVLKTERAYSVSMIEEFNTPPPNSGVASLILVRMFGWVMQRHYVGVLDFYDEQLALASKPWIDVHNQIGQAGSTADAKFGPMAGTVAPSVQSLFEAEARNIALLRSLRLFNAVTKFRAEKGREASGIDELAIPKNATIDPFSGLPLKVKLAKEGWVIYSVMKNGVDDGGDFVEFHDYGVAPTSYRVEQKKEESQTPEDEAEATK
jgi:hypothetical protein